MSAGNKDSETVGHAVAGAATAAADQPRLHRHLPRLPREFYQGHAMVHWTMTLEGVRRGHARAGHALTGAATGADVAAADKRWLCELSHARFRELLLHATVTYGLLCPAYCLMPDHVHLLNVGVRLECDQALAMAWFRRHVNGMLAEMATRAARHALSGAATGRADVAAADKRGPPRLQKQAYDNVLREQDRERGAFQAVAHYILENPVEAGLCARAQDWPYSGCVVPGHPDWNVFHDQYWDSFWAVYAEWRAGHALAGAATGKRV